MTLQQLDLSISVQLNFMARGDAGKGTAFMLADMNCAIFVVVVLFFL